MQDSVKSFEFQSCDRTPQALRLSEFEIKCVTHKEIKGKTDDSTSISRDQYQYVCKPRRADYIHNVQKLLVDEGLGDKRAR